MKSTKPATGLGKQIVAYSPYRRRDLALKLLLSGSSATVLWYLISRLDRTIFVPLGILGALPLCLLSLNYIFRMLAPGKRVAVYERGIVLGGKRFQWDAIQKASYHLDVGSREDPHDRQVHNFTFYLRPGERKEILMLEEDALPSHVNVPEFLGHLERAGLKVEDENAPKIRRDKSETPRVHRNLELAGKLCNSIEETISKISGKAISEQVVAALRQGERVRIRVAWRYRLSSLALTFLEILPTLVMSCAVLLAIISGITFIAQITSDVLGKPIDLLEDLNTFGLPTGLVRYAMLAGVIAAAVLFMRKLEMVVTATRKLSRKHSALASGLKPARRRRGTVALLSVLDRKEPFGIYLRSFSGEYFQYLEKPQLGGSSYVLPLEFEAMERDFDAALVSSISDSIPIFALANVKDASAPHDLHQLFTPDTQWLTVVCELISKADIVILYLSEVTESVIAELRALDRLKLHRRSFIIRGQHFQIDALNEEEQALLSRFSQLVTDDASSWESALRDFLRACISEKAHIGASL